MNVFKIIKEKKDEFQYKKRMRTAERLREVSKELKIVKAEAEIYGASARLTKELRQSKKDLFDAKHPFVSAGLKSAGKKLKENRARNKGVNSMFQSTGTNPFTSYTPESPFHPKPQTKKKRKKKK